MHDGQVKRWLCTVVTAAMLVAVAFVGAPAQASTSMSISAAGQPQWAVAMLRLVNAQRAKVGARPLVLCQPLMDATRKYARVMARTGHVDHTGPDGRQPWERGVAEGYQYQAYGENIAAGQRTVRDVMRAWVGSPGHYANLVSTRFTHLGVGHAVAATSRHSDYWVQNFGAGGTC